MAAVQGRVKPSAPPLAVGRLDARNDISDVLAGLLDQAASSIDEDRTKAKEYIGRASALLFAARDRVESDHRPQRVGHVLAPWLARRIKTYIDARLNGSIQVGDLAAIAELTVGRFSRAFKGSFGKPPHAYIVARRIDLAQRMMLASDAPLSQIALACGLCDQAHFTRLFRREVGQPPGVWRREWRAGIVTHRGPDTLQSDGRSP